MKAFPLVVYILPALSYCNAFNVGKFEAPTEKALHHIDEELLRQNEQMEKYLDQERTYLFPHDPETRHSSELPTMQPKDREWRNPSKKDILTKDSVLDQTYKPEDRAWAFPDKSNIRQDNSKMVSNRASVSTD